MLDNTYVIEIPSFLYDENECIIHLIETEYGSEYIKNKINNFSIQYDKEVEEVINKNNPFNIFGKSLEQKISEVNNILEIDSQFIDIIDFIDDTYTLQEYKIYTLEEWIIHKKEEAKLPYIYHQDDSNEED